MKHYAQFAHGTLKDVGRQTVAHFHGWTQNTPKVGDTLIAVSSGAVIGRRGLARSIISATEVRLLEILTEEELVKLGRDQPDGLDDYFESWDKLHPDALAKTNPLVLRIEVELDGYTVPLPHPAEIDIIDRMCQIAHDEMTAFEDARAFADLGAVL
jgi:hypothetical protein